MSKNLIIAKDTTSVEIDARLMNRDFDNVDNEINHQLISEAMQGDNDDEMAALLDY